MSTPEQREILRVGLIPRHFDARSPYGEALQAVLADAERLERLEAGARKSVEHLAQTIAALLLGMETKAAVRAIEMDKNRLLDVIEEPA